MKRALESKCHHVSRIHVRTVTNLGPTCGVHEHLHIDISASPSRKSPPAAARFQHALVYVAYVQPPTDRSGDYLEHMAATRKSNVPGARNPTVSEMSSSHKSLQSGVWRRHNGVTGRQYGHLRSARHHIRQRGIHLDMVCRDLLCDSADLAPVKEITDVQMACCGRDCFHAQPTMNQANRKRTSRSRSNSFSSQLSILILIVDHLNMVRCTMNAPLHH